MTEEQPSEWPIFAHWHKWDRKTIAVFQFPHKYGRVMVGGRMTSVLAKDTGEAVVSGMVQGWTLVDQRGNPVADA